MTQAVTVALALASALPRLLCPDLGALITVHSDSESIAVPLAAWPHAVPWPARAATGDALTGRLAVEAADSIVTAGVHDFKLARGPSLRWAIGDWDVPIRPTAGRTRRAGDRLKTGPWPSLARFRVHRCAAGPLIMNKSLPMRHVS